jgi:uncharacterized membrane protein YgdD (TMEM256/DUF423 family)
MTRFYSLGAFSAAAGVALGAFAAHGLRSYLSAEMLAVFETGVRYQMYHSFGLLAAAFALGRPEYFNLRRCTMAGWCFVCGIVVFPGSLYFLSLTGLRWAGSITPLGGISFIAGWVLLALGARGSMPSSKEP